MDGIGMAGQLGGDLPCSDMSRQRLLALAASFAIATAASPAIAAQRSGPGPCREAVNGLVSLLDSKMDNTSLYRDTFATVVNTCGPPAPAAASTAPQPAPDRTACHDLASAMTDIIEDDKMNAPAFVKARSAFAQSCAPR
jgi:hypothetical protein